MIYARSVLAALLVASTSPALACVNRGLNRETSTLEDRLEYARDVRDAFETMLNSITPLSPIEETWLQGELSSTDFERRRRAENSLEHTRQSAHDSLEALARVSGGIVSDIEFYMASGVDSATVPFVEGWRWNIIAQVLTLGNNMNNFDDLASRDLMQLHRSVPARDIRGACAFTAWMATEIVGSYFRGADESAAESSAP